MMSILLSILALISLLAGVVYIVMIAAAHIIKGYKSSVEDNSLAILFFVAAAVMKYFAG